MGCLQERHSTLAEVHDRAAEPPLDPVRQQQRPGIRPHREGHHVLHVQMFVAPRDNGCNDDDDARGDAWRVHAGIEVRHIVNEGYERRMCADVVCDHGHVAQGLDEGVAAHSPERDLHNSIIIIDELWPLAEKSRIQQSHP